MSIFKLPNQHYINQYYLTEVDKEPDTIYCHHAIMGEKFIPEHHHDKGQFLYTEGGVVYLNTEERSYFLPARHFIWIPPNVIHSINPSSPDVIMRNLYFPIMQDDNPFFFKTGIYPVDDLLMQLLFFTNRWNGHIYPDDVSRFTITAAFKMLLPELNRFPLPLALPYPKDKRLLTIVNHLDQTVSENKNFKDIALHFAISERSLARLFQKDLKMSFIQYYTILRMLKALKLLLEDRLSINEVAHRVGYNSLPTFSNTFTKVIGVRPSEYIKVNQVPTK